MTRGFAHDARGFADGFGFADDFDVFKFVEQAAQKLARRSFVVGNHNSEFALHKIGLQLDQLQRNKCFLVFLGVRDAARAKRF